MREVLAVAIGVLAGICVLMVSFHVFGGITADRSLWLSGSGLLADVLRQFAGGLIAGAIAGRKGFFVGALTGLILVPLEFVGIRWFWDPVPWSMLVAALPFAVLANTLSHSIGGAAGQLLRAGRSPNNSVRSFPSTPAA